MRIEFLLFRQKWKNPNCLHLKYNNAQKWSCIIIGYPVPVQYQGEMQLIHNIESSGHESNVAKPNLYFLDDHI